MSEVVKRVAGIDLTTFAQGIASREVEIVNVTFRVRRRKTEELHEYTASGAETETQYQYMALSDEYRPCSELDPRGDWECTAVGDKCCCRDKISGEIEWCLPPCNAPHS